jgi:hypothetical protein
MPLSVASPQFFKLSYKIFLPFWQQCWRLPLAGISTQTSYHSERGNATINTPGPILFPSHSNTLLIDLMETKEKNTPLPGQKNAGKRRPRIFACLSRSPPPDHVHRDTTHHAQGQRPTCVEAAVALFAFLARHV